MAQITKILKLTGEEDYINGGMDSVAKRYGWVETVTDENGDEIPNPVARDSVVLDAIKGFLRDSAVSWNIELAASQAREAALAHTEVALNELTLTFEE